MTRTLKRDAEAPCLSGTTGMSYSILAEIGTMLQALAEHGRTAAIDLRSLPMTDADRKQLEELLGRGEVSAMLYISGPTEVWETTYHGVWWIRHMGVGDKIATEEIAVTKIPEILMSHPKDVEAAARRIQKVLDSSKNDLNGHNENEVEASYV